MLTYKKHTALFFAILFSVSQFIYVGHFFFHSHHHHLEQEFFSTEKSNKATCKIEQKEVHSSNDFFNCFICQQHQTVELYQVSAFAFSIKNTILNNKDNFTYTNPYFSNNLLQNPSLRAPPSVV